METYYRYIGCRLSANQSQANADKHLSIDFSQLNIDVCLKKKQYQFTAMKSTSKQDSNQQSSSDKVFKNNCEPAKGRASEDGTGQNTADQKDTNEGNFIDKFLRSVFRRKHRCCRCQRWRSSCAPNKTFNGLDTRFTCFSCRKSAETVRKFFNGNTASARENTTRVYVRSPCSQTSSDRHAKHRDTVVTQESFTDSGYEDAVGADFSATSSDCSVLTTNQNAHSTAAKSASHDVKDGSNIAKIDHRPTYSEAKTKQAYDGYLVHSRHAQTLVNGTISYQTDEVYSSACQKLASREHTSPTGLHPVSQNSCHVCRSEHTSAMFRLPWEGGWICEDCLDVID